MERIWSHMLKPNSKFETDIHRQCSDTIPIKRSKSTETIGYLNSQQLDTTRYSQHNRNARNQLSPLELNASILRSLKHESTAPARRKYCLTRSKRLPLSIRSFPAPKFHSPTPSDTDYESSVAFSISDTYDQESLNARRNVSFLNSIDVIPSDFSSTSVSRASPLNNSATLRSIVKIDDTHIPKTSRCLTGEHLSSTNHLLKQLQRGNCLQKLNSQGKLQLRWFWVNGDGTELYYSRTDKQGTRQSHSVFSKTRCWLLADCVRMKYGISQCSKWRLSSELLQNHKPWQFFSLHFDSKILNCISDDERLLDTWFLGLQSIIPLNSSYISHAQLRWQRVSLKLRHLAKLNGLSDYQVWQAIWSSGVSRTALALSFDTPSPDLLLK